VSRRRSWLAVGCALALGLTAGLAVSQIDGGGRARARGRLRPGEGVSAQTAAARTAAGAGVRKRSDARRSGSRWIAVWAAGQQAAAPGTAFARGFRDQTVRDVIHVSLGGRLVRIRVSNAFGSRPLRVGAAAIAAPGAPPQALTFAGRGWVTVAPGAQAASDPVHLAVRPLERLTVSLFLPAVTGPPTEHFNAHQTNYLASGDRVMAGGAAFHQRLESWYFLSGVDVWSRARGALVALGDSITNGNGSLTGAYASWPDDLARRLAARAPGTLSVVDVGMEGNRVLNPSPCCGPSALARFSRDVLRQPGVREVIVLEGINDIGFARSSSPLTAPHTSVSAEQIIAGYEQLIHRAHAAGLKIFGATLTPFAGSQHWSPAGEAEREQLNAWIRGGHGFDGVIDFAAAVADPRDPRRLDPRYDDGDHLHLNDAGYRAMADAVNLAMLLRGLE